MNPSYCVHTLYPDIMINNYSIIQNKELKEVRDANIIKYLNFSKLSTSLSCNEFDNIHANIIKYIFNDKYNKDDVHIVITLRFHEEDKMCFLIGKHTFVKCKNIDVAIQHMLSRHRNDLFSVHQDGGTGKFVLVGDQ
jgi:hypothetical protein